MNIQFLQKLDSRLECEIDNRIIFQLTILLFKYFFFQIVVDNTDFT